MVAEPSTALERADDRSTVLERWRRVPPPALQAAAVAATSFVAGAVAVAVVHRQRGRGAVVKARPRSDTPGNGALEIVASRSFLVDVHVLRRP